MSNVVTAAAKLAAPLSKVPRQIIFRSSTHGTGPVLCTKTGSDISLFQMNTEMEKTQEFFTKKGPKSCFIIPRKGDYEVSISHEHRTMVVFYRRPS